MVTNSPSAAPNTRTWERVLLLRPAVHTIPTSNCIETRESAENSTTCKIRTGGAVAYVSVAVIAKIVFIEENRRMLQAFSALK